MSRCLTTWTNGAMLIDTVPWFTWTAPSLSPVRVATSSLWATLLASTQAAWTSSLATRVLTWSVTNPSTPLERGTARPTSRSSSSGGRLVRSAMAWRASLVVAWTSRRRKTSVVTAEASACCTAGCSMSGATVST